MDFRTDSDTQEHSKIENFLAPDALNCPPVKQPLPQEGKKGGGEGENPTLACCIEKKLFAKESLKTQKAREKLKKKLEDNDKKITPQALEKKTIEIHNWIHRHAKQRVILKCKDISLFDENQNAACVSKRIDVLVDQLRLY